MKKWIRSDTGPICPYCKHQITPDEGFYYDESLEELECDDCGKEYDVRVFISTDWETSVKDDGDEATNL